MSIFNKHLPAIHVPHYKNTMNMPTEKMPVPNKVRISMSQHIGAPCTPTVEIGDKVKVGQVIGDTGAFVSAPIHSSVSGKVTAIEQEMSLAGNWEDVIVIVPDKKQEVIDDLAPPEINSREDFIKAVRASGMVGLGGAAFPTHVKYSPKNIDEVDTLIINGAECEPFITSDYRTMIEDTDLIVNGIKNVMKYLGLKNCVIGIEDNKPIAIEKLSTALEKNPEIRVQALQSNYPQGGERVLIYETTGKSLPVGKLPADVGVIVSNVATIVALERYLETGMPLISKKLTVDGSAIKKPKNIEVLIGTSISDVIAFCGGYRRVPRKIIMGGPMMGRAIYKDSLPIIKNNNAILAFDEEWASIPKETPCINCGRCARACSMHLVPTAIFKAYENKDIDDLKALNVALCMECGSCSYVCPAKKPLSFMNKFAKAEVAKAAKGGK